jgi:hypothetical protein
MYITKAFAKISFKEQDIQKRHSLLTSDVLFKILVVAIQGQLPQHSAGQAIQLLHSL